MILIFATYFFFLLKQCKDCEQTTSLKWHKIRPVRHRLYFNIILHLDNIATFIFLNSSVG